MADNNNRQRENYFQSNIAKYGENFIHNKTPKMLQFDAKNRLFKEMVNGFINYDEFGVYFTDPEYLDNLIAIANALNAEHAVISRACIEYSAAHGDVTASQLAARHNSAAIVFGTIAGALSQVKQSGYNIQSLMYIVTATAPYRRDFSELY